MKIKPQTMLIVYGENHGIRNTNLYDVLICICELCNDKAIIIDEFLNNYGKNFNINSIKGHNLQINKNIHYSIILNFIEKNSASIRSFNTILNKIKISGASYDMGYILDAGLIYDMGLIYDTKVIHHNSYMIIKENLNGATRQTYEEIKSPSKTNIKKSIEYIESSLEFISNKIEASYNSQNKKDIQNYINKIKSIIKKNLEFIKRETPGLIMQIEIINMQISEITSILDNPKKMSPKKY